MFPILNPPPSSLPIPSLWVVPVHQPQASSIVHRTCTGNSFHTWYYTYFNAILPNQSFSLLSSALVFILHPKLHIPLCLSLSSHCCSNCHLSLPKILVYNDFSVWLFSMFFFLFFFWLLEHIRYIVRGFWILLRACVQVLNNLGGPQLLIYWLCQSLCVDHRSK